MMSQADCPESDLHRDLIDRHFRGRISPQQEQTLRRHLPDCEACRTRYDRYLLNSRLAGGLPRSDRLAIGLGMPRLASPARRWATAHLSVLSFATAAAVLLFAMRQRGGDAPATGAVAVEGEFTARGAPAAAARAATPALFLYRRDPRGQPVAVRGWIGAGDELAFAYGNPTGFRHLAVFGADESGNIYWFFPAWTDPKQDPPAMPIEKIDHRELPEAIGHAYQGSKLRLVGLFLDRPVSVRAIEKHVRGGDFEFADLGGAMKVEKTLEIRR